MWAPVWRRSGSHLPGCRLREGHSNKQGEQTVKKTHQLAAVAGVGMLAMLAVLAVGQGVGRPAAPMQVAPSIALIDVNYIFKNHARFKQMMANMKADVEQAEGRMKQQNDQIRQWVEQLKNSKPGDQGYKELEEAIAKARADMQVQMSLQRKEFLSREAKIYHTVYQEIEQVVRYYAAQNGIVAVLRFNGDPVDPDDPEAILRDLNKPVVWHADGLDISNLVLETLNRSAAQTATPTQPGARRPTGLPTPY